MWWVSGVVAMLAWGAAAFGAVYAWAYLPLAAAAVGLGVLGLMFGRAPMPWSVVAATTAIVVAVAAQLIPLSAGALAVLSPHAIEIHRLRDLNAAIGVRNAFPLSIDARQTQLGLVLLVSFAVLLAGTARTLSRDSARRLAAGLAGLGVALSIVGVVQRATFNGRIYGFWELQQGGAPFGPFINRNHFAGWMLMVLPLTVGLFGSIVSKAMIGVERDWRSRILWLGSAKASQAVLAAFAVLTMALALALTLSRSGITAISGALVISALMMSRRYAGSARRLIVPLYLGLVAIIVLSWVGVDRIAARFAAAGSIDMEGRRAIWADTGRMIQDFWLTGTGLNTFGTAALFYQELLHGSHMREAHSDYLQLAAEGGLLTGVPVSAAMVFLVAGIRRRLREDVGSIWWIRAGAASGLLAIAAQSLVEFSLQMPANAALFAVLCGLALHDGGSSSGSLPSTRRSRTEDASPDTPGAIVQFTNHDQLELSFDERRTSGPAVGRSFDPLELDASSAVDKLRSATESVRARLPNRTASRSPQGIGVTALITLLVLVFMLLTLFGT